MMETALQNKCGRTSTHSKNLAIKINQHKCKANCRVNKETNKQLAPDSISLQRVSLADASCVTTVMLLTWEPMNNKGGSSCRCYKNDRMRQGRCWGNMQGCSQFEEGKKTPPFFLPDVLRLLALTAVGSTFRGLH